MPPIACEQAAKGQVLVQIGPMDAKEFDVVQFRRSGPGQTRVLGNGKPNLGPALHVYDNLTSRTTADRGLSVKTLIPPLYDKLPVPGNGYCLAAASL